MAMNKGAGILWFDGTGHCPPLGIRFFDAADVRELCSWFSSEADVVQWAGPKLNWQTLEKDLHAQFDLDEGASNIGDFFSVVSKTDDLMGHFQLTRNKRTHQTDLSRVAIGPAYRSKGFARSMLERAVQFAFEDQVTHRLELRVFDFNEPAIRAYKRLGFQVEGVRRQSVHMNGDYWNTVIMGILRADYERGMGATVSNSP